MKTTTAQAVTGKTHIVKRTGRLVKDRPSTQWLHYLIIRDASQTILDLVPAPWGGWNLRSIEHQGANDWRGYSADHILAQWVPGNDAYSTLVTGDEATRALDMERRAPEILASREAAR